MGNKILKAIEMAKRGRLFIFTPILLFSIFILSINLHFKKIGEFAIILMAHLFFVSTIYEFLWEKTMFWLVSIPYEKGSLRRLFLFFAVLAMFIGASIKDLKLIL